MNIKKLITAGIMALAALATFADPTVTDVVAKQRYPWDGLVDITCKVTGISGTGNDHYFSVAAVMPDTGNAQKVSHFWVVRNGTNSTDPSVSANGSYRLLWDASADLGQVAYDNMVMRVSVKTLNKVQLWEGGPYWATTNIGAENPEDYGYYFWWGDTVGYKREHNKWVATDGSSSNYSFGSSNTPTDEKDISTLMSDGWITADGILVPAHDAAHVHWGGTWRMPTKQEQEDLVSKCDWTWTTQNGVRGCVFKGRGAYASASIFFPCAGTGGGTSLYETGSRGEYWSSEPEPRYSIYDGEYAYAFGFHQYSPYSRNSSYRCNGRPVRPVQGFTE